jgi:hypothetical protein
LMQAPWQKGLRIKKFMSFEARSKLYFLKGIIRRIIYGFK